MRNGPKPMPAKLNIEKARPQGGYEVREEAQRRMPQRAASESRGPVRRESSRRREPQGRRRTSDEEEEDEYPSELYDMYRNSRSNKGGAGRSRNQSRYIEEEEEDGSDYDDGSFDENEFEMVSSKPPLRSQSTSRGMSRRPEIRKIRVKVHAEDTRYIMIGTAIEFIVRFDLVEVDYAEGDEYGVGEPVKNTLRHIEVKVDETGEFSSTRIDQGWDITIGGTAAGLKDMQLKIISLKIAYGSTEEGSDRASIQSGSATVSSKVEHVGGTGSRTGTGPFRETLVLRSGRAPAATDRENDEQCAAIRKSVLEIVATKRKERAVKQDATEKAAARLLDLAKDQLKRPEDEAVGRELLELVIHKYGQTKVGREARKTWNDLPGTTGKYFLDNPPFVPKRVPPREK